MTDAADITERTMPDPYRQQRLLSEFGSYALSSDNLQDLLDRACQMAAEGLGQQLAKIVKQRDGKLEVVASFGYDLRPEDMVLDQVGGTSAGHAVLTGTPTVSRDVIADERFERATIERGGQVRSVLNVPIPDIDDDAAEWYGVIEVDSPDIGAFREEEVAFLKLYADLVASAIGRHRVQRRLEMLLDEKARLLKELQHRVKNNLTIISSLTRIEARKVKDPDMHVHLSAIEQRIETLRLLHETLYRDDASDRVALHTYIDDLARNLTTLIAADDRADRIVFDAELEPLIVSVDCAIPLGLILNEFVTNSIKYALADDTGRIWITLRSDDDGVEFVLVDNGPGMPEGTGRSGGTGMSLISGLASQIDATVAWDGSDGMRLTVRFPLPGSES